MSKLILNKAWQEIPLTAFACQNQSLGTIIVQKSVGEPTSNEGFKLDAKDTFDTSSSPTGEGEYWAKSEAGGEDLDLYIVAI